MFRKNAINIAAALALIASGSAAAETFDADYTQLDLAGTNDGIGHKVGISDYDLASGGRVLLQNSASGPSTSSADLLGQVFTGYFASLVTAHTGATSGANNGFSLLDINPDGAEETEFTPTFDYYELTLLAGFSYEVTSIDETGGTGGSRLISYTLLPTGSANLFYDITADANTLGSAITGFGLDASGTDSTTLMNFSVTGGSGTLDEGLNKGSIFVNLHLDSFLGDVFDPDNLLGAEGDFVVRIDLTDLDLGYSSFETLGGAVAVTGADIVASIDGNLYLFTPIPAAVWLFASAIVGFVGYRNRRTLFGANRSTTTVPA